MKYDHKYPLNSRETSNPRSRNPQQLRQRTLWLRTAPDRELYRGVTNSAPVLPVIPETLFLSQLEQNGTNCYPTSPLYIDCCVGGCVIVLDQANALVMFWYDLLSCRSSYCARLIS